MSSIKFIPKKKSVKSKPIKSKPVKKTVKPKSVKKTVKSKSVKKTVPTKRKRILVVGGSTLSSPKPPTFKDYIVKDALKPKKLSSNKFKKMEKEYLRVEQSVLKCADKNCKGTKKKLADHNESVEKMCRGRNVKALEKFVCIAHGQEPHLIEAFIKCKKSKCKRQMNKSRKLGNEYHKQWLDRQT